MSVAKPTLEAAAGRFLLCPQFTGPTPYQVQRDGLRYQDLEPHFFTGWSPCAVVDRGVCTWGSHSFAIGPAGELTFHASNWDTSD